MPKQPTSAAPLAFQDGNSKTTIRLTLEAKLAVSRKAKALGCPEAEVIRRAIDSYCQVGSRSTVLSDEEA